MQLNKAHLRPEQHSGQTILRPMDYSEATPKLASSSVFFPPTIGIDHSKQPIGALVEAEAQSIVAMKAMKTSELRERLFAFANLVLENDRRATPL